MKKGIIFFIINFFLTIIIAGALGLVGGFYGEKYFADKDSSVTDTTKVVQEDSATIAAVEKAGPAVVSIVGSQDVPVYEQYMQDPGSMGFPFFSIPQYKQNGTQKQDVSAGTGFIVSSDGYIVTNNHVVSGEGVEYTVFLSSGEKYSAQILANDTYTDLAVLKIDAKDLPILELGDSANLKPGQTVIAIGYALGEFKNTVSRGVISGLGRSIEAGDGLSTEQLENIIQTDAAINSGNSGGPLLNIDGQIIGINVAMAGNSENIGFAIAINDAKSVIDTVKSGGQIVHAYLGVRYVPITAEIKDNNQLSVDYGVLVTRGQTVSELAVLPGSPADKAGIEENDIILEIDGQRIDVEHELSSYIQKKKPGDKINLKILHDGVEKTVEVTLEEAK